MGDRDSSCGDGFLTRAGLELQMGEEILPRTASAETLCAAWLLLGLDVFGISVEIVETSVTLSVATILSTLSGQLVDTAR